MTHFSGDFETRNYFGSYLGLTEYDASAVAVADDAGKLINVNTAGASTYTISADVAPKLSYDGNGHVIAYDYSGLTFPVGTKISLYQGGVGAVTLTAGAGVTFVKKAAAVLATSERYARIAATKIAANTWLVENAG